MSRYRVRHHYRYEYSSAIADVKQRLIMVPPDLHLVQVLDSFDLDVRGANDSLSTAWHTDAFGNRVCRLEAARVDHALDFEVWFTVHRTEPLAVVAEPHPDVLKSFLSFTALTAPDSRIHSASLEIAHAASSVRECIDLAHDWAAQSITYQIGVTGAQTPAAMALHLGQGVCQDYAHIMLSLLRCLGVPARYVSGHLLGEGAPHAWVEVLLTQPCMWLAYDPTHHRRADAKYITVATGRDFADVSPTSGVFSGAATGRLHWSKHAELIDDAAEAAA
jgi:transglutaminase-like putative cysteine protease